MSIQDNPPGKQEVPDTDAFTRKNVSHGGSSGLGAGGVLGLVGVLGVWLLGCGLAATLVSGTGDGVLMAFGSCGAGLGVGMGRGSGELSRLGDMSSLLGVDTVADDVGSC